MTLKRIQKAKKEITIVVEGDSDLSQVISEMIICRPCHLEQIPGYVSEIKSIILWPRQFGY